MCARGRLAIVCRDVGDPSPAGALAKRALDTRHRLVVTFHERLDPPVGEIPHPSRHPFAICGVLGEVAVAHTLHAAADQIVPSHTHRFETAGGLAEGLLPDEGELALGRGAAAERPEDGAVARTSGGPDGDVVLAIGL